MSYAMSMSKSRWKGALLATVAASVLTPLAANAQSMTVGITTNPMGGVTSPNDYTGMSNVYIDPYTKDTLYVYATVTGTAAPSASYVDGLEYLYFNVNATATGATGLGAITSATPSTLFSGGSYNQTSGNTSPGAGVQGGVVSTTAYTSTPSLAVGSTTTLTSIAKPRSAGDLFVSSTTNQSSNVVVTGNSVSFLVETLTYTPKSSLINTTTATTSAPGAANSVAFNISNPSVSATFGSQYYGANYFVGLPSTPSLGTVVGASSTLTNYNASTTTVHLTNALPGDVNLDGLVNGTDLAIVNSGLNTSGYTNGYSQGDLNEDGLINGTDLAIVNSNLNTSLLGTTGAPAGALSQIGGSAVPEPTSLGLLALGGLAALRRRRVQA